MAIPSPILIYTEDQGYIVRRRKRRSPALINSKPDSDWRIAYFEALESPTDVLLECIDLSESLELDFEAVLYDGYNFPTFEDHFARLKNTIVIGLRYYNSDKANQNKNVDLRNRLVKSHIRLKDFTDRYKEFFYKN